jgi:endonuclease/exonuclease/phosphatase family metal-dependent hydrolase
MFQKEPEHQVTFKEPVSRGFKAPWLPNNYAQIDYVLTPNKWKNTVKNVQSEPLWTFNSDHLFLSTRIKIKLKAKAKTNKPKHTKYYKPEEEEQQT